MKNTSYILVFIWALLMVNPLNLPAQKKKNRGIKKDTTIVSNSMGQGLELEITAIPGRGHNHPTFVVWLEKEDGTYIETLFATQYIGKGVFRFGTAEKGRWEAAPVQRKAAVPYWGHKRGIKNEQGNYLPSATSPLPDAITGPTPPAGFTIKTRSSEPLVGKIKILMEVNQTWDWNPYWNNALYPDDADYHSSAQPAVVYAAEFDASNPPVSPIRMKPIGHSHYSGATGELFSDLQTLTTALQIFNEITVKVSPSAH
ncbi:MAG: hypothetical protein ACP5O2_04660 [Bacteroidales bacterium]